MFKVIPDYLYGGNFFVQAQTFMDDIGGTGAAGFSNNDGIERQFEYVSLGKRFAVLMGQKIMPVNGKGRDTSGMEKKDVLIFSKISFF